jgi:hypothetical protein
MIPIIGGAAARNNLFRILQRLPDSEFEKFVKAERRRRRETAQLFRAERDRWHYRRGLTKSDQIQVMRRSERSWRVQP